MALPRVATFTDTYLPTINGVTYTVKTWRDCWESRGGTMDIIYPDSSHTPSANEHPVESLPVPFYDGLRLATPQIPDHLGSVDVVHAHSPFSLGLAGRRLATSLDATFVVSYHTPTAEYASYLTQKPPLKRLIRGTATEYERWFLNTADIVTVPSQTTASRLQSVLCDSVELRVVSNGVDTSHFEPTDTDTLREQYQLSDSGPFIGYTGRHGYEKELQLVIDATARLDRDVTLILSGDGPARSELEARARERDIDTRFLGWLDRSELPALYSFLDIFAFPSPVETQGLVALEAIACGTPVVGVEAGALTEGIDEGTNGYAAPAGDRNAFANRIEQALSESEQLSSQCLSKREALDVGNSIDKLRNIYTSSVN